MADDSLMTAYINRENICKNSTQVLTTGDWEFSIDFVGKAMYMPSVTTYFVRTTGIDGVREVPQVDIMEIPLRGFTLRQPGLAHTVPDPVTLHTQDFEDQTITIWLWDWANKMNNLSTLASYRREDLFVDLTIWQLNSSRQKVYQYNYHNCLPDTSAYTGSQFTVEKNPQAAKDITFQGETWESFPLNIPT